MKITYLIGNGFDLHFGLKTRYRDFYNYYIKQRCTDERISNLRNCLINDASMWSDLECALGALTQKSSNAGDFIAFLEDMNRALADFFNIVVQQFVIEEQQKQKVLNDMVHFEKYFINSNAQRKVYNFMPCTEAYKINFIVFNYTDTLEKIIANNTVITRLRDPLNSRYYNANVGELIHIHGTSVCQMVFGVNDASQILNRDFAQNEDFLNKIVKPFMNRNSQTERAEKAEAIINDTDVICIYGMSIGETDKTWWEAIGKHLAAGKAKLIIFDVPLSNSPLFDFSLPQYEEKKRRFINMTSLDECGKNIIRDRIFVCLSNEIF